MDDSFSHISVSPEHIHANQFLMQISSSTKVDINKNIPSNLIRKVPQEDIDRATTHSNSISVRGMVIETTDLVMLKTARSS